MNIVWEEITRAKEPVSYYTIEDGPEKWFDLIKPFTFKNKNGRYYDFFYCLVEHNLSWNSFCFTTTLNQMLSCSGRLHSLYSTETLAVKVITFLGINDGVTKLYGAEEAKPTSIKFYGGYLL